MFAITSSKFKAGLKGGISKPATVATQNGDEILCVVKFPIVCQINLLP